ncbi:MAG TPA: hypothetical protein VFG50_07200 [Rhodothermales bacterium]|nr:hypothetical protein [Rhodothermales bacterium]
MTSRTTALFRKQLAALPGDIQRQAKKAYQQFKRDPWHSSLRFKQVHPTQPIYSVRIAKGYRAVGKWGNQGIQWFWIGSHADYDALLKRQ